MKRISYSLFLLCATALAGCTHEEAALENGNGKQDATQGSQVATLTATIGIDTRTWADGTTVKWSDYDDTEQKESFRAFSADGYSYGDFVLQKFVDENQTSATFLCDKMVGESVSELKYAVYPADCYDIATKTLTFSTEYTYPNSNAPMFGTITNGNVVFGQLLSGMVRITLEGLDAETTSTLKLSSSSVPQTATLEIDADGKASLTNISSASSAVSIDFTSTSTTQTLDIPMPVGTYQDGIDVTLVDGIVEKNLGTISGEVTGEVITNMESKNVTEATSATITLNDETALTSDDLSSYTDLTISGTLDATDLTAIKEWATLSDSETAADKTLDLSDATITEEDVVFTSCTSLTKVVLPEGTTSIADNAFDGCTNLESVGNTEQVETIGTFAFHNCKSLTSIDLSNVTTIGNFAFDRCSSLESVDLSNVTTIGNYAFSSCTSLTLIDLSNVTSIGDAAFYGCSGLTSIEIPSSVTSIGEQAFANCSSLATVTCKADITTNSDNFAPDAFAGIKSGAVLYVPNKYKDAYTTKWGSYFKGGVEAITSSGSLTGEITGGYGE